MSLLACQTFILSTVSKVKCRPICPYSCQAPQIPTSSFKANSPFGKHFTLNDIFLYYLCVTTPIIEEAIFLGTLKWCQMLDGLIVFKTQPSVLVLHTKSSRKQPPNHLRTVKCVAMYIHVWGREYMWMRACVCKHDSIYILEASICLFWMQIKLQQSFLETLLLGNLRLLCNLVSLLYIVCGGTVYLLNYTFMIRGLTLTRGNQMEVIFYLV